MSLAPDAAYSPSLRMHSIAWTPILLGALVATAFSTVLVSFGAAVGLGVASSAPSWRDASVALWLLSGIYLILVALISFGIGGYIAGRLRGIEPGSEALEIEHSDGMHGLASWAVAVVLGAVIAALVGSVAVTRGPAGQTGAVATAGA